MSRILLVEDENDLMQLNRDVLSGAGHEVDGFADSLDAFSRFQPNPDHYAAVISDVRMQEMSGIQLAMKLKKINKNVQIFLMSAYESLRIIDNAIKMHATFDTTITFRTFTFRILENEGIDKLVFSFFTSRKNNLQIPIRFLDISFLFNSYNIYCIINIDYYSMLGYV